MNPTEPLDLASFLGELDAGVFEQKIVRALQDVALAVAITGNKGRVLITFAMERIGESTQVELTHKLAYLQPTERGKLSEENTTSTPLHVGSGGRLSIIPTTADMFTKNED